MLRVDALTFAHPGQASPYVFTFDALPGAVTAISGVSGSGKSTLLDLVAGFLVPTAGHIELDGTNLVPLPPEHRPVSLLLQSQSLFDHLRTSKNLRLGLPVNTAREIADRRIEQALDEVDMRGFEKQLAGTLSGGQKQRIALARTLLRDRPVLLLDEPFSALDDANRATIRSLVKTLTQRHRWHTILVSHHTDDIQALADRSYRLIDGQLQRDV